MDSFEKELESVLNKYSQENGSNTPDFILARYLNDCLTVWNHAIASREQWYGRPAPAAAESKSVDNP